MFSSAAHTLGPALAAMVVCVVSLQAGDIDETKDSAMAQKEPIATQPAKISKEKIPTLPTKILREPIPTQPARIAPKMVIPTPPAKNAELNAPFKGVGVPPSGSALQRKSGLQLDWRPVVDK